MTVAERIPGLPRLSKRGHADKELPRMLIDKDGYIGSGIDGLSRLERRQRVEEVDNPRVAGELETRLLSIRDQVRRSVGREPIVENGYIKGICFDLPSYCSHDEVREVLSSQSVAESPTSALLVGKVVSFRRPGGVVEHITFDRLKDGRIVTTHITIDESTDGRDGVKGIKRISCTEDDGSEVSKVEVCTSKIDGETIKTARLSEYKSGDYEGRRVKPSVKEALNELESIQRNISDQMIPLTYIDALEEAIALQAQHEAATIDVLSRNETDYDSLAQLLQEVRDKIASTRLVIQNYADYLGMPEHSAEARYAQLQLDKLLEKEGEVQSQLEELVNSAQQLQPPDQTTLESARDTSISKRDVRPKHLGRRVVVAAHLPLLHR